MVKAKENCRRANIYISDEIHSWYSKGADEIGISMSGYMAIALKDYMDQKNALKQIEGLTGLSDIMDAINKVQRLKEDLPIKEKL